MKVYDTIKGNDLILSILYFLAILWYVKFETTAEATVGREGRSGAASAAAGAAGDSTVRNAYKTDPSLDLWTVNSFFFKRREKHEN